MATNDFALKVRAEKAREAELIGIDEELISTLVDTFYARIQADEMLGPIFAGKINDWPAHLSRMKDFWSSVVIGTGRFHGNPMIKHVALAKPDGSGVGADHFQHWLQLFSQTLDDVSPTKAAKDLFADRAARIAESLHTGMKLHSGGLDSIRKTPERKGN